MRSVGCPRFVWNAKRSCRVVDDNHSWGLHACSCPAGSMDMALGLRTMVIPTANTDSLYNYSGTNSRREWTIHLQVRGLRWNVQLTRTSLVAPA